MQKDNYEWSRKILAVLALVIAVVLVGHITSVVSFNQTEHIVNGTDDASSVCMDLGNREDSTSSWLKRDFDLYGETVDLKAQTFDGTLYNRSSESVASWVMTMKIKDDCFINNAWCGTVEIHQYVGTPKERVQLLDLRNYQLADVKLDYLYDGDLLIPLTKGDYVVYFPSEKDRELVIQGNSELTMGMIFYFRDTVDLTDYQLRYYAHKPFYQGPGFYAVTMLTALWLAILFAQVVSIRSYRRAWKEMEMRKTGISYMSDMYDMIYIVDLSDGEITPLQTDKEAERRRTSSKETEGQLMNLFLPDVTEPYYELMHSFADLDTLPQRMERDSIVCDYVSKSAGWCQARFFAMDRDKEHKLQKVIFTIQNINDERLEMERMREQINQREDDRRVRDGLFDEIGRDINTPIRTMLTLTDHILEETNQDDVRGCAREIRQQGDALLTVVEGVLDASKLSAGQLKLEERRYSLRKMLEMVLREAGEAASQKQLALNVDISPGIPDGLVGDRDRLYQIISYLLKNGIQYTEKGSVKLSVFGKKGENSTHLLISVKDTGRGMQEEEVQRLTEHWKNASGNGRYMVEEPGISLNLLNGVLGLMDSGLHVLSTYGEGSEFYFEIDQTVFDPSPIGKIEL